MTLSKRFDELYPPMWSVPFTYRGDDGRILRGGHWDYRVDTPEAALEQFYIDFKERQPEYAGEGLEVDGAFRDYEMGDLFAYAELLEAERDKLQAVADDWQRLAEDMGELFGTTGAEAFERYSPLLKRMEQLKQNPR